MRLAAPVLVCILLFAGCLGKEAPTATEKPAAANNSSNGSTFALPVGGTSAAAKDTNATTAGAFGMAHTHDYWKGHESIVIYQRTLSTEIFPLFPDGQGSSPRGVFYVVLPNSSMVYEGTSKLTILAQVPAGGAVPSVAPPTLSLQYRTAADGTWRDPQALAYGKALEIPVTPEQTDMPHSTQSLWLFRIETDRPDALDGVNLTITVYKGRDVANWPGHPDFYPDGKTERVVFDGDVKTHQDGFPLDTFYEQTAAWAAPTRLISYGTGVLDVFVNVTSATVTPPVPVTRYTWYMHNATQLGVQCCDGNEYLDADGKNDLKSYHFHVNVSSDGMDGPYQPASRWGFHLAAVTEAFTDSTSYDLAYHVTIIARKASDQQMQMLPP